MIESGHDYVRGALARGHEALWWKCAGLDEAELRRPRTATGTNLLGLVKHVALIEGGYFGAVLGRDWPTPEELITEADWDVDPQADWYARADESAASILDLSHRVAEFVDAAFEELEPDAPGEVPWWPPERRSVTFEEIALHVLVDLTRHVGHADILREDIDGAVGLRASNTNIPDDVDWNAYREKLERLAEGAERT